MAEDRVEELKRILQQNEVSVAMLMRLWSTISINCTVLGQPWKITCVKSSGK